MPIVDSKGLNLLHQTVLPILQVVEKVWGKEFWVLNTPNYCMKVMNLLPQKRCSLHRHLVKTETFIVQSGWMEVETKQDIVSPIERRVALPGEPITIEVGVWHRFSNYSTLPCKFIEISTHHEDDDVQRLEDSGSVESYPR